MAIAEISIVPIGTGTPSVSQYVAKAIKALGRKEGVKYKLTGMGTILEGNLTDVLEAVREMHEAVFDTQIKRVVTSIRIDDRRDREASIQRKVQSVTQKLA
jgi:uncharacterized protein (TIGR00106 family)